MDVVRNNFSHAVDDRKDDIARSVAHHVKVSPVRRVIRSPVRFFEKNDYPAPPCLRTDRSAA